MFFSSSTENGWRTLIKALQTVRKYMEVGLNAFGNKDPTAFYISIFDLLLEQK